MSSFGAVKFKHLLLAGSFTVLANYVIGLTGAVVAGNLIGSDALAGINLVNPINSAISFLAGLVATGVGTEYSLFMGRCDRQRARQFFMQGCWTLLLAGGAIALGMYFGRGEFIGFFGASPMASSYARDYLAWAWPIAILEGVQTLFVTLGYADGDTRLCIVSYLTTFVLNIVVSVIAVKFGLGTSGCALGSIVSIVVGILVISAHFFRRTNTFRPVMHFSLRDSCTICVASFGDAAAFLCDALLFLFINKFAIMLYGPEVLPVVGVAAALWGFLEFFNGIGVAAQPVITVYYGERNTRSIRQVMNCAMKVAVIEGLTVTLIFGLFPTLITSLVGLSEPSLVNAGCTAVRCMCFGFVALAFAGLFNSYYEFIERPYLAATVTFLCYLVLPVASIATMGLFGVNGLWLGIGCGPHLGILIAASIIVSCSSWKAFPLLLDSSRDAALHVFDLTLDETSIARTAAEIAATLKRTGKSAAIQLRASLMTEEVFMVVRERARGRKLLGEATLDLNDGVELTLRDDGETFDITDADQQISSLRSFLVASVMEKQRDRLNIVTTGFNRNVFRF